MGWLADRSVNPSVIYATYAPQGRILKIDESVVEAFKSINVCRIIVGHQPLGDAPLIITGSRNFHVSHILVNFAQELLSILLGDMWRYFLQQEHDVAFSTSCPRQFTHT